MHHKKGKKCTGEEGGRQREYRAFARSGRIVLPAWCGQNYAKPQNAGYSWVQSATPYRW